MATYFSGMTVQATLAEMEEAFGPPDYARNYGSDKVNFEFRIVFNGITYTIYDWKEYQPIGDDEQITFHIGGISKEITETAKSELLKLL